MKKSQIIKIIVCFLPLLLLFLPAPAGMNPKAWELFPFYAGAILGIMLHPFSEAAILLIFLGFYSVTMKGQAVALSGYALAMTWLVVGAFVIAQAFRDTQLGKRIAYHLIRIFGRSAIGLGYAAAFSDFIIAPMTPFERRSDRRHHFPDLPLGRGDARFHAESQPGKDRCLSLAAPLHHHDGDRHHVPHELRR